MTSNKTESFCSKFLLKVSGIEKKTIDTLLDNGFDSVHSLLAIKDEYLNQMSDICLAQKAILRKQLKELQKEYRLIKAGTNLNYYYKRLLKEYILEDNGCPPESPINTSNNSSHNIETHPSMTTPNPSTKQNLKLSQFIDKRQSTINEEPMTGDRQLSSINSQPLIVDRQQTHINGQPLTAVQRFGLRSTSERKKKRLSTDEEDNDNTPEDKELTSLKPQIGGQTKSCKVCDRMVEGNRSLCKLCRFFYDYHKTKGEPFVCNKDNKCLIKKNSQNNCLSCRWNKCLEVMDKFDSDNSCGETSSKNVSFSLSNQSFDRFLERSGILSKCLPLIYLTQIKVNDSHKFNAKISRNQSCDQFMENNKYLSESQPNIDLTPIKLNNNHKYSAKNQKIVREKCAICGDIALGRKYGVISCFGCASFFKRAHRLRNGKWKCIQLDGKCEISPQSKNSCKFCRYYACITAGMALRSERFIVGRYDGVATYESTQV